MGRAEGDRRLVIARHAHRQLLDTRLRAPASPAARNAGPGSRRPAECTSGPRSPGRAPRGSVSTNAAVSRGSMPAFCGSVAGIDLDESFGLRSCFCASPWRASAAIFSRSTVSMTSNSATASFALLDCSGPIRCSSTSAKSSRSAGHLACASCTRFSPKTRWPASSTGRMSSASKVLDTATSVTDPRVRPASAFAAAASSAARSPALDRGHRLVICPVSRCGIPRLDG